MTLPRDNACHRGHTKPDHHRVSVSIDDLGIVFVSVLHGVALLASDFVCSIIILPKADCDISVAGQLPTCAPVKPVDGVGADLQRQLPAIQHPFLTDQFPSWVRLGPSWRPTELQESSGSNPLRTVDLTNMLPLGVRCTVLAWCRTLQQRRAGWEV